MISIDLVQSTHEEVKSIEDDVDDEVEDDVEDDVSDDVSEDSFEDSYEDYDMEEEYSDESDDQLLPTIFIDGAGVLTPFEDKVTAGVTLFEDVLLTLVSLQSNEDGQVSSLNRETL